MNLNNLSVGLRLKSYKALCELLEEPVHAGNSKVAHLKEFERYFSYVREGNAYIIQEIYDIPKAPIDGRQKYIPMIEPILMNTLATDEEYHHSGITWSRWYRQLGMVNEMFYDDYERKKMLEEYQIGAYTMFLLSNIVSRKCHEVLLSALFNMKKRNLIDFKEHWYIISKDGYGHAAREGEEKALMRLKDQILEEMGCNSMKQVFLSPKRYAEYDSRFHKAINNGLWRNAYKALRIKPVGDIHRMYQDIDIEPLQKQLNSLLLSTLTKIASNTESTTRKKMTEAWIASLDSPGQEEAKIFSLPSNFSWNADLILDRLFFL